MQSSSQSHWEVNLFAMPMSHSQTPDAITVEEEVFYLTTSASQDFGVTTWRHEPRRKLPDESMPSSWSPAKGPAKF